MKRRTDWRQVLLTIGLVLLAIYLGSRIWNLGSKASLAWHQAHDTKSEYEALEARKSALEANLAALATPRGQDAAVREAFGVAKPGEEVIVVVPPATTSATTTRSWWGTVKSWF